MLLLIGTFRALSCADADEDANLTAWPLVAHSFV
jgi:hypothetical protein